MTDTILDYVWQQLLGGREGAQVTAHDDLLGSGLVDSMGMMSLIAFIENHFSIKIPPQEMTIENFGTVADIVLYIEKQQAA